MFEANIHNLLVFPLVWGSVTYGLIYLHNVAERRDVVQATSRLLQTYSIILGAATERVTMTRRRQRAAALLELEHAVDRHARGTEPLMVIANEIYGFTGSDLVTAFYVEDGRVESYTAGRWGQMGERPSIPWRTDAVRRILDVPAFQDSERLDRASEIVLINLEKAQAEELRTRGFAASEGVVMSIVIPFQRRQGSTGGLVIDYRQQQRLSRWQLDELRQLGKISAAKLHLLRLLNDERAVPEARAALGESVREALVRAS